MNWSDIVGQTAAKSRIEFYINAFKSGEPFPSMIACGPRGNGKTELMESTALKLKEVSGGIKRGMVFNCASFKTLKQFWNSVVIPVVNDKDVTIFLDEAHKLHDDITNALLSMTNPNVHNRNSYTYDDYTVDVDLCRQTFLYATTEPHKVFHALINRCRRVDLEDYTNAQLGIILKRNAPGITIPTKLLTEQIAPTLRGNAREATLMAKDIKSFLAPLKRDTFTVDDWKQLQETLSINPLGLTPLEIKVMETLDNFPHSSLTRVSAKMMMTPGSVRQDLELYLLKHELMEINQAGRNLTPKGRDLIKTLKTP